MNDIIKNFELKQIKRDLLCLHSGDTVEISVWITDGEKKRLQIFEGIIIGIKNRGLNSAFTVRKISNGEGVERVFQTYSPIIKDIKIKKLGMVRKAKLYYLRNLKGRSARIKTRLR